jgi:hypothetical protein
MLALVMFLGACVLGPHNNPHFDEIMMTKVRTKAAFDFQCAADSITVTKIDNGSYGAVGCEHRATYVGKETKICWSGNSDENLKNHCQVVPDTFVKQSQGK